MFGLFGGKPSAADMRRADRRKILQGMTIYGKDPGSYASQVQLDSRALDALPGDFLANQEGYVFTTSPYAPSAEYESAGYQGSGATGSGRGARASSFYLFKKKPDRLAELRAEQTRLAKIAEEQYKTQTADIAKQLKIVQDEKSAVSKMTQEYTKTLAEEAERRRKAQEEARIAAQTAAANRVMEGRSANLQIQGAGSVPRTGGTAQFRRRAIQQGTASPYKGLSTIASGMVNV